MVRDFWRGRRVFITGHTGFKGSWLCRILKGFGAEVTGYALPPPEGAHPFRLLDCEAGMHSVIGDIRDARRLADAFARAGAEIVIHMAALPLVLESYACPAATFETNVMGTVNLFECVRGSATVRSVINVTTDKVYRNREPERGYREDDRLGGGGDPYSCSKACSEIVTACYSGAFLADMAVSTVRSGNVIAGGDFSENRIIPDCVRAAERGEAIRIRNPGSVRPYQHVLEALFAYMEVARRQYGDPSLAGPYNVGPADSGCVTTGELADMFCRHWGDGLSWVRNGGHGRSEAGILRLDCTRMREVLGWRPVWSTDDAVAKTVEWEKIRLARGDVRKAADRQIGDYLSVLVSGAGDRT